VDVTGIWESFRENVKTSGKESRGWYEFKQCKSWFDEEYSELLDKWLQNPNQVNRENVNV
jgi:hypothetical protein